MAKKKSIDWGMYKVVGVRFLRTFVPQIPAICAYLVGIKPEYTAVLSFLGAVATSLDKLLRELKVY